MCIEAPATAPPSVRPASAAASGSTAMITSVMVPLSDASVCTTVQSRITVADLPKPDTDVHRGPLIQRLADQDAEPHVAVCVDERGVVLVGPGV